MRIELDENDVLLVKQPLTTNGEGRQRYKIVTKRAIRIYYDFEKAAQAVRDHWGIGKEEK